MPIEGMLQGMSGSPQSPVLVPTQALWTWTPPAQGLPQQVISYPTVPGAPTKTGLLRADLEAYIGTPIQLYTAPPGGIDDATVVQWIRWAEDDVETETNIRLCQTWIAAPPAKSQTAVQQLDLGVQGNFQALGIDYDIAEAGYDFFYERWRDNAWGYIHTRWRPVKSVEYFDASALNSQNFVGIKNVAFIYPLLNQFFRMPNSWVVEDQNRGLVRFVPAVNVQMLPLFAMVLAFTGFAEDIPQGLWFQYTAGLTQNDYISEWSFMKQLVLAKAGITAYNVMQTSISFGALELTAQVDGLMRRVRYSEKGPFYAQLWNLKKEVNRLMNRAKMKGGGIHMGYI